MVKVHIDGKPVLNEVNAVGVMKLLDYGADPTGEGEITRNGLDIKMFAGNKVVSISGITAQNGTSTAAPGASDDTTDGWSPGSVITDTTNDDAYVCLDATEDAAVWGLISGLIAHTADSHSDQTATGAQLNELVGAGVTLLHEHKNYIVKASDETVNNSTTIQNDDDFVWALEANKVYELYMHVTFDSNLNSDFKYAFTVPTGGAIRIIGERQYHEGTSYDWVNTVTEGGEKTVGTPATTEGTLIFKGTIINGANAGNLQFQWAQDSAEVFNTKVYANSWGYLKEIG